MPWDVRSATWMRAVSEEDLLDAFGEATLARGMAYAMQEKVRSLVTADRGRMILAEVEGSRHAAYQTLVTATDGAPGRGRARWTSRCSCPMRTECKHVAAVLHLVRAAQADRPEASGPPPWEAVLAPLLDLREGAREAELGLPLALIIEPVVKMGDYPRRLPVERLAIRPTRWMATGRWAKKVGWGELDGYSRQPVRRDHLDAVRALHREATRHLPTYAAYSISEVLLDTLGPRAWELLRRCVDTGVQLIGPVGSGRSVVLAPHDLTVALDVTGGGGDLSVRVVFGDTGFPGASADGRPPERSLIGEPAHGLSVTWDGEAGPVLGLAGFDRPLPDVLRSVALDDRPLHVPAADAERFRLLFLPRLGDTIRITSSDGSVEAAEAPEPVVSVVVTMSADHGVNLDLGLGYPMGLGEDGQPVLALTHDNAVGLLRNHRLEQDLLREVDVLAEIPGAVRVGARIAGIDHLVLTPRVSLRGLAAARFVVETLPDLEGHPKVAVLVRGALPAYDEVTDAPTIEVGASSDGGNDWLDLHVVVRVEDEIVPFEPLFEALARGDDVMILESGSWFRLDRPELQRLRELIEEARLLDDRPAKGDRARLNRFQVDLFEEFAEIGDLAGGEVWRARLDALRAVDLEPRPLPEGVQATLRPYQLEGFQWLAALWDAGLGGVLADDMGLGKTLQALALIQRAKEAGELSAPVVVVAPTSVLETWRSEAERFTPGLRVVLAGETERRRGVRLAELVVEADVVVTSYAVLRIDADAFASQTWRGCVIDEAQFVKNPRAKGHAAIRRLGAPFVLAITGTPLENSLMDLWSLLALAAPGLYPRADVFSQVYRRPIESGAAPEQLDRLRRRIRPLMLRRTKDEVATELPPKQIQRLDLALGGAHERIYQQHLQRERQRVLGLLGDPEANRIAILASLTRLRQLALDPALVDDAHAEVGSAKLDALVDHLLELRREGHRALVFSQFTRFLRRAEARLAAAGVTTSYLDGQTTNRPEVIRGFRGGDQTAFLISLKAGGFGLTLTEADYVFILDPWWNPAAEAQAIDRTHRIGQDKPVMVYRLISSGTIEEKVVALQDKKRDLFERVVDEGGALSGALTAEDIRALLSDD